MTPMGRFRGRGAAYLPLALILLLAATPVLAGSLCAIPASSGAVVYTNTPTNDGHCAPAMTSPSGGSRSYTGPSLTEPRFDSMIRNWAGHYNVSAALVHAVVSTESAYNPAAVSSKGARGLMQLMPQTAKRYGVSDSFDADQNIRGGVAHLRDLLDTYGGNTRLAVAAYNAGAGAVNRYSGVPPYAETRNYVKSVLGKYRAAGGRAADSNAASAAIPASPVVKQVDASGGVTLVN